MYKMDLKSIAYGIVDAYENLDFNIEKRKDGYKVSTAFGVSMPKIFKNPLPIGLEFVIEESILKTYYNFPKLNVSTKEYELINSENSKHDFYKTLFEDNRLIISEILLYTDEDFALQIASDALNNLYNSGILEDMIPLFKLMKF